MKRIVFIIALFAFAGSSAQTLFTCKTDSASCADRKARKVRTLLALGSEYNLSTAQFGPVKKQDTLLYCKFDREGRPVEEFTENGKSASRLWARYDQAGHIVRIVNAERDSAKLSYVFTYTYDQNGRVTEEKRFEKEKGVEQIYDRYVFTYAPNGTLTKRERFKNRGSGTPDETRYYSYDARGLETASLTLAAAGDTTDCEERRYDAAGNLVESRFFYWQGDKRYPEKKVRTEFSRSEMSYDSTGNMTALKSWNLAYRTGVLEVDANKQYVHDAKGRVAETRDGRTIRKFTYSKNGALQSEIEYFENNAPYRKRTYTETYYT